MEQEFAQAVEEHRIEEIYWVGGEPLMYEQHWKYMQRIIELGDGPGLYARYNTNLSRVDFKGINLYNDILDNIRDWQVCASIDGTGDIGEYIRTGLKYDQWFEYFRQGIVHSRNRRMMRIDFTLTTPGLFEVVNICKLAKKLDVDILAKVVFAFGPDIAMSPLFLPRHLLESIVYSILENTDCDNDTMRHMLVTLLDRPTFEEEYPDTYLQAQQDGKLRIDKMDRLRGGMTFSDTIAHKETRRWWNEIS